MQQYLRSKRNHRMSNNKTLSSRRRYKSLSLQSCAAHKIHGYDILLVIFSIQIATDILHILHNVTVGLINYFTIFTLLQNFYIVIQYLLAHSCWHIMQQTLHVTCFQVLSGLSYIVSCFWQLVTNPTFRCFNCYPEFKIMIHITCTRALFFMESGNDRSKTEQTLNTHDIFTFDCLTT